MGAWQGEWQSSTMRERKKRKKKKKKKNDQYIDNDDWSRYRRHGPGASVAREE